MSSGVPRFISEKEIAERKLRNAAEGKQEEPYDPRSLYDRLQAERARKQEEYEASTAFKNQIHRIDPEEADFLAKVDEDRNRMQESAEKEAMQLIMEAKAANRSVLLNAANALTHSEVRVKRPPVAPSSSTLNQRSLLAGIKRKGAPIDRPVKKPNSEEPSGDNDGQSKPSNEPQSDTVATNTSDQTAPPAPPPPSVDSNKTADSQGAAVGGDAAAAFGSGDGIVGLEVTTPSACVLAGYLPGLAAYDSASSDEGSDCSSTASEAVKTMSHFYQQRGSE